MKQGAKSGHIAHSEDLLEQTQSLVQQIGAECVLPRSGESSRRLKQLTASLLSLIIEKVKVWKQHEVERDELLLYAYNVDGAVIPPAKSIEHLFTKTKGECMFTEENACIHPYFIPNTPFQYKGDLVDGLPSGFGTVTYNSHYSFEGHFLNGRKHGPGKLIIADETGDTVQYQHHYHGKRFGPFVANHEKMGSINWDNYGEKCQMQNVSAMSLPESNQLIFFQVKDNKKDGFVLTLSTDTGRVLVERYKANVKIVPALPALPLENQINFKIEASKHAVELMKKGKKRSDKSYKTITPIIKNPQLILSPLAEEIEEIDLDIGPETRRRVKFLIDKIIREGVQKVSSETMNDLMKTCWNTVIPRRVPKQRIVSKVHSFGHFSLPVILLIVAKDMLRLIGNYFECLVSSLESSLRTRVFITEIDPRQVESSQVSWPVFSGDNSVFSDMELLLQLLSPLSVIWKHLTPTKTVKLLVFIEEVQVSRPQLLDLAKALIAELKQVNAEFFFASHKDQPSSIISRIGQLYSA